MSRHTWIAPMLSTLLLAGGLAACGGGGRD